MNSACEQQREALELLLSGRFDALAESQIEALEAHLAVCDACAQRLALAPTAPRTDELTRFVAAEAPQPTADAWARVWRGIEAAGAAREVAASDDAIRPGRARPTAVPDAPVARVRMLGRVWAWQSLAAAAMIGLVFVGVWRGMRAEPAWTPSLGGVADVQELEVAGGSTPIVLSAGGDAGVSVIWVIEEGESL